MLGAVYVGGIGENADGHARAGDVGEPAVNRVSGFPVVHSVKGLLDSARETLVTLGVVVLETNLEFDGLNEVAPLLFCA